MQRLSALRGREACLLVVLFVVGATLSGVLCSLADARSSSIPTRSSFVRIRPLTRQVMVEAISASKGRDESAASSGSVRISEFISSMVASTSLREMIGIEDANSIIVPLLGVLRLPSDTVSLSNRTLNVKVVVKGYQMDLTLHMEEDSDFLMTLSLSNKLSEDDTVSSSLEDALSSGNNKFLSRFLNALTLGGAKLSIGVSCPIKTLLKQGTKGDCKPSISLEGTASLKEKLGYLPALGDVEYSISLSREDGLELSVSAPELQNSKIELSKGVGSITIKSGSIRGHIGSKPLASLFNKVAGLFSKTKKSNSTAAGTDSILSESWSAEEEDKGNYGFEIKGSVELELLSYKGSSDVELAFNTGTGGLSFTLSDIKHPQLKVSGVSFALSEISFSSAERAFGIKGMVRVFNIPLECSARIENATQSYKIVALVRMPEDHEDVDFESMTETKLPGLLKKLRFTEIVGELEITPEKVDFLVGVKGIALDRIKFALQLGIEKSKGERPDVHVELSTSLKEELPLYEVFPTLSNVPVLNGLKFISLDINPLLISKNKYASMNASCVVSMWNSKMALSGIFETANKTYSFSIASLPDASPIALSSVVPSLANTPIAKDIQIKSFSISLTKTADANTPKFEITAQGKVLAFDINIEASIGGDQEHPRLIFETVRSADHSVEASKGLPFLQGLPVGGFMLDKISGSLIDRVVTFSIEGTLQHKILSFDGKLILDMNKKTGSLDMNLNSADSNGAPLSDVFSFAKNVKFLEKITLMKASLSIHREEGKQYSGSISLTSRMWGVPVQFSASIGGGKVSVSISNDPGQVDGVLLADHIPSLKNIDCLSDTRIESFSLKVEKELEEKKYSVSLSGKAEILGTVAELNIEYLDKGLQASFSAKSKDSAGIPVFQKVSWLKNIPIIKDIRFISLEAVAQLPEDKTKRQLFFTSTGSIGPALLSVTATLTSESKTVLVQVSPNNGRESIPLTEMIPMKGIGAQIAGSVKLKEFTFSASLLGDDSSSTKEQAKSRLRLSLACELILFGVDFSGSFSYSLGQPSFMLQLGKAGVSKKLDLSKVLPDFKSVTDFLGNIEIGHVVLEYADGELSFEGNVELFRISLKIEVRLDSEKNIYVAATALSNRQSLSVASMIPALRDNEILKSFAIEEVKLTLNKTKSGTTFSIEGSATLFKIPVSASLLMGTGGRLELKIFTPAGRSVPLSTIIPSVSNVPILKSIVFQDFIVGYSRESSNAQGVLQLGGEIEIEGIGLRGDVFITSKGFTVAGSADFSRVKTSNAFLKRMMSMTRKFGVIVSSYSHAEPLLDNQIIEPGVVAVYGEINTGSGSEDVSGSVDKVTGSSGAINGLRFTGMISADISKCSLTIKMPGFKVNVGSKGSSAGVELYFSGLGPSFALKFRLTLQMEEDSISFVAAIAIRPTMLSLSGSMVGRWDQPFGLKNTYIENLAVQVGINLQTGLPAEFGFMGTVFVHPIELSIAVAVAVDGGILVSGSINILSMQAILGVVRTLGAKIPESFDNYLPEIELSDLRLYICSRPISIGEFKFNPGFSFAAGLRIYSFHAYVSISAGSDGFTVFGAMSAVKLGPLTVDRLPDVKIPEEVSKLGPAAAQLPKEITSISEAEKVASAIALAELDKKECSGKGLKKSKCLAARSSFAESSLPAVYNGPVLAISFTKSSQLIFFTGRVRLLGQTIAVHIYLSTKRIDCKIQLKLFGFITAEVEFGADVKTMSNIRFRAEIRVRDLREEILNAIRKFFGLERQERKKNLDEKANRDAEIAKSNAKTKGDRKYRECVIALPDHLQNNDNALQNCANKLRMTQGAAILTVALGERVAALYQIEKPSTETKAYRDALTNVLVQVSQADSKNLFSTSFVQSYSRARWGVWKKIKRGVRRAWNAVVKVAKTIWNTFVKFVKAATDAIARFAIAAANAIIEAAKAAWRWIGEAIFAVVKALLDAFWLHRAFFEADLGSLTNPGYVSAGIDIRLGGKEYSWSFTLDLSGPMKIIKKVGDWVWDKIKKMANWFSGG